MSTAPPGGAGAAGTLSLAAPPVVAAPAMFTAGGVPALPLAHAAGGWQALATLEAAAVAVVFLLVVGGVIPLRRGGDLVLPLSAALILGGSLPVSREWGHAAFPYAVPAGLVLLGALVAAALGRLTLARAPRAAAAMTGLAAGAGAAVGPALAQTI